MVEGNGSWCFVGLPNRSDTAEGLVSKVGGQPVLPHPGLLGHQQFSNEALTCAECGASLYFILQLCCPEEKDRYVYVFMCNSEACINGIRVLIVQRFQEMGAKMSLEQLLQGTLSIQKNKKNSHELLALSVRAFPPVAITWDRDHPALKIEAEENIEEVDDPLVTYDEEPYEETYTATWTRTFAKFELAIERNPWQLIRYRSKESGLAPLYYEDPVELNRRCSDCGSGASLEFQMMPAILSLLPTENEEFLAHLQNKKKSLIQGMDWRTILVYTCDKEGKCRGCPGWQLVNAGDATFRIGTGFAYLQRGE